MKIGILTLPLHTNYGGNLQAHALLKVLKKEGHEVVFLDRRRNKYKPVKFFITVPLGLVKKYVLNKPAPILDFYKSTREYDIVSVNARKFIEHYINPKSEPAFSGEDLLEETLKLKLDAIVVGSDQVWKPSYTPNIFEYFLGFIDGNKHKVRKVSYAASFGNDDWKYTDHETKKCASLVQKFDALSVREDLAVKQCTKFFGVEASHVLDPTLLLDADEYVDLFRSEGIEKKQTISSYVLDRSDFIDAVFARVSSKIDLPVNKLNTRTEELNAPVQERIAPPVESWLKGIFTSEMLITDSFHGCAFAILFNVPFIVIGNERRGIARFNSLLTLFNLQSRMVKSEQDIQIALEHQIDWDSVNAKLNENRERSYQFIRKAFS
ncbi:polysaccharide pyruvyl transferase family protein [Alteromonas confluentis]|uniref:Polysaccharide pyruvyl transferase domain-containing protein n=1 Tax=Alteromonas confluentis TaxID=1656094 RepID=A0A1E7Z8S6_9ALTE|nr:polysaccharide pyruvyl transferase family protein [Alteromonas confluentis]OFC69930.1 hypothetical protein BFC18_15875 [Alteromonas confluentis]